MHLLFIKILPLLYIYFFLVLRLVYVIVLYHFITVAEI
jgi:hypothetical protein